LYLLFPPISTGTRRPHLAQRHRVAQTPTNKAILELRATTKPDIFDWL